MPTTENVHVTAWRTLHRTHQEVEASIDAALADAGAGLTTRQYDVLATVADGPRRMADVAALNALSPSGLTRVVDSLEAEGLVARERVDTDRRGVTLRATRTGTSTLRTYGPFYEAAVAAAMSPEAV